MTEACFAAALLDPTLPPPVGLPATRFAIYRNSVTSALVRNLEVGFPVIRQLVGAEFFTVMAKNFLRQHPPRTRLAMLYGSDLSDFLTTFAPVADYPYLADVARLEQARRESYHAADSVPIPDPVIAMDARLTFAPSLRLIRSAWPIHSIWRFHQDGGTKPAHQAEDVVVLRPIYDPKPHLLPPHGAALLSDLQQGLTVQQACFGAATELPVQSVLDLLLQNHAILQISTAALQ